MKKILILSSFPAPYRVDVFKGIADCYDVDVIFGTGSDQNRNSDYFVSSQQFGYYLVGKDDETINSLIKNLKQYFIVLAYDWYLPYALKIEDKCIKNGIPYIVNCDGALNHVNNGIKSKLKALVKKHYISNAAACFASGRFAKQYFISLGAKEENIYIHNFSSLHRDDINKVPVSEGQETENRKSITRRELNLPDKKTILSIGQFIPRKGYDVLLNAWGTLDNDNQLIIVGGGDEAGKYESIIKEKGYKNVYIVSYKPKDEIVRYYMAADLFVLPTREDIWGLVINEACAFGLPVISTDRCVAAMEIIEEGKGGYIVKTDDHIMLHGKMEKILNEDMTAMGVFNQRKVSKYTIEDVVESHLKVIRKFEK